MLARFAAAAALILASGPASAVVLGTAHLRIDGDVVFTAATSAPVFSAIRPADGSANPFSGIGYGFIAELTGTLSAVSTLPPGTPAIYEVSGVATLGDETLAELDPQDLGVLRLNEVLAAPPFPSILAALASVPLSGTFSQSDASGALDGFFSYAATPGAGALTGAFNGFIGFDDPITGIDAAATLVGGFDPRLGDLVNALLSDLFLRSIGGPSPSEPFSLSVDVSASVIPVPLAAPMLIAAVGMAAAASRRRRVLQAVV